MGPEEDGDLDPLAPTDWAAGEPAGADDLADPLAPVMYGDEEQGGDEEDPADGGVSDPEGIARVWVEDGRLTKVRVSPVWYTKLGRRSLGECFSHALQMANATVAAEEVRRVRDYSDEDFSGLPQFSSVAFAAFQGVLQDVHERWAQAIEHRGSRRPRSTEATVGRSKGVTVSLNDAGLADTVAIDEKWLDTAQAGQICTHVQKAAEEAYARYVPPASDREELDSIEDEHAYLTAAFKAMLNARSN